MIHLPTPTAYTPHKCLAVNPSPGDIFPPICVLPADHDGDHKAHNAHHHTGTFTSESWAQEVAA